MPGQTTLHNWTTPADGDRDYEDSFDQFFAELDDDVEIRDTESNLGNYDPVSGAKFLAEDTENVFIGDGSSWNKLDSSGKNPNLNSLTTDKADITSSIPTYQVWTDGTTVWASPSQNATVGYELSEFEDTSWPVVYRSIINELPPQGDPEEARGKINLKNGDYPGGMDREILPTGLYIEGETFNHFDPENVDTYNLPEDAPGVRLRVADASSAFIPPTGKLQTFSGFSKIQWFNAEWNASKGDQARILNDQDFGAGFDWLWIDRYTTHGVATGKLHRSTSGADGPIMINGGHERYCGATNEFGTQNFVRNVQIQAETTVGRRAELRSCSFRMSGEKRTDGDVIITNGGRVIGGDTKKTGGTDGNGRMFQLDGDHAELIGMDFTENTSGGFNRAIFVNSGVVGARVQRCNDFTTSGKSFSNYGTETIVDDSNHFPNGADWGGTRTHYNGIIGGGPTGGTDIGSLTGATTGDFAVSDGTTATNAGTLWRLLSSGDWQRVDGGATVTPA